MKKHLSSPYRAFQSGATRSVFSAPSSRTFTSTSSITRSTTPFNSSRPSVPTINTRRSTALIRSGESRLPLRSYTTAVPQAEGANWLQKFLLLAVPGTVLYVGGNAFYEWFTGTQQRMQLVTMMVDMPLVLQDIWSTSAPFVLDHPLLLRTVGPASIDPSKVRFGWHLDQEAWITYPIRGRSTMATVTIELLPLDVSGTQVKNQVWRVMAIEIDMNDGTKLELETTQFKSFDIMQRSNKLISGIIKQQQEMKQRHQKQKQHQGHQHQEPHHHQGQK